jgi:hypothetical protein
MSEICCGSRPHQENVFFVQQCRKPSQNDASASDSDRESNGILGRAFQSRFASTYSETAEAYEWTYRAVTESLYAAFNLIKPCVGPVCCTSFVC